MRIHFFLLSWYTNIPNYSLSYNVVYQLQIAHIIARKSRRNNGISHDMKKTLSLSCLLAAACFVVLFISVFVYIGLRVVSKEKDFILDNVDIARLWSKTITSFNSTFNCLIFYWKNKILRVEGTKVIKSMNICR